MDLTRVERPSKRRAKWLSARAGVLLAAVGSACAAPRAMATAIPTFESATGTGFHFPGSPGGSNFSASLSNPDSTNPGFDTDFDPNVINFPGGSTTFKAGLSHTQGDNSARVLFARGTGLGQTDPGGVQTASSMQIDFSVTWNIFSEGTFGPPINTAFSLPLAYKVGAQGAAGFFCDVHWDVYQATAFIPDARAPYSTTRTYAPGMGTDTIIAPSSPFAYSVLGSFDKLVLRGTIRFIVNNEIDPSYIGIPTVEDFPELAGNPILNKEAELAVGDVPEPTMLAPIVALAAALASRRRRRTTVAAG
jgi:hypothetical protein